MPPGWVIFAIAFWHFAAAFAGQPGSPGFSWMHAVSARTHCWTSFVSAARKPPPRFAIALAHATTVFARRGSPLPTPKSPGGGGRQGATSERSEEHTSELQSQFQLVCRLLLEKKKKIND